MLNKTLKRTATGLLLTVVTAGAVAAPGSGIWADVASPLSADAGLRATRAERQLTLDIDALRSLLQAAPGPESDIADRPELRLPLPNGGELSLRLFRNSVMAPGLAARHPAIQSFVGVSATRADIGGRFDLGPNGFHGQLFTPEGTVYIDPLQRNRPGSVRVYYARDLLAPQREADVLLPALGQASAASLARGQSIAGSLLTYRLALATTGEYAQYHDPDSATPDVEKVLAELVTLVNRVSGIYERELGVRLELIEDSEALIFTDPDTDPYRNASGSSMLNINTRVINDLVGESAYDIGHVVSTGGGGIAGLGVVCGTTKGAGVTGLSQPVGDAFYVDYVAHEMGHQFGANHSFNGTAGSCGGNRHASTAYEPGSGSTIMSYAGICAEDDIAEHSDDYFHAISFDEIVAYTRSGGGNRCALISSNANQAPVADAGSGGFTIPVQTPFELQGSGSDPDGDTLYYQWEQWDLGAGGSPDAPDASAPLFRSFPASESPLRVFPQPADLLNNAHTLGEILPTVSRSLNFRLNVRDRRSAPESGGVASADLAFAVTDQAGPFRVVQPNAAASYPGGSVLKVKWKVAGTDRPPVSCAAVDIWLSRDGGYSWSTLLKKAKPNDGAQNLTLPNERIDHGRIKVKCSDNVFFDLSDVDFAVVKQ